MQIVNPTETDSKATKVRAVKKMWKDGGLIEEVPWGSNPNDYFFRFQEVWNFLHENEYPFAWSDIGLPVL